MNAFTKFEHVTSSCRTAGARMADFWFCRCEHDPAASAADMDARRLGAMIGLYQGAQDLAADIPAEYRAECEDLFFDAISKGFFERLTALAVAGSQSGGAA
jgi:hypothetical protein